MKYLQLVPAPSPIESWLHTQLEARGVDRVYSRYILSLFHSTDVIDHDFLDLDIPSKELKRLTKKKSPSLSHYSLSHSRSLDARKLIRASVIETLRSVAETKAGIESLVDELCSRLHSNEKPAHAQASLVSAQSLNNVSVESDAVELAQKYYDAFPALDSNPQPVATQTLSATPWNGKHARLLGSIECPAQLASDAPTKASPSDNLAVKEVEIAAVASVESELEESQPTLAPVASVESELEDNQSSLAGAGTEEVEASKMDCTARVKRKLFVEVDEPKDSLTSLMARVDGTKDLWESDGYSPSSSCSSLLPPAPLVAPPLASGFIPCGTNLTTSIWSEVEWGGKWSDDSGVCLASPLDDGTAVTTESRIKPVLNHCPVTSAFQPVVLGSNLSPVTGFPPPPPSQPMDENLLTSSRTHFCPIDKVPHYKTQADNVQYANGTTFSIMSQLDEIAYHVGQDGTLSWDSGTYMEFKANGLNTECYNLYDPFKPKFRVYSVSKSIQTDGSATDDGGRETCDVQEDFYFPGEESIARDIMRSLEEAEDEKGHHISLSLPAGEDHAPLSPLLLDAWAVAWPPFSIWSNTALAAKVGDGWPSPTHDYQELSKATCEVPPVPQHTSAPAGVYANYSIWAPPLPLDSNSNVILCATKCETPLPLGVNMGNLKISSDRKRRHSSSQFAGAISTFPCIKSEVSFFQQSITL